MKSLLIGLAALIIGAAAGIFIFTTYILPYSDVNARAAVFEGDRDYFFQNASEVFPTRTVARGEAGQPLPKLEGQLDGFTFEYEGKTRTLPDMYTDMETSGLIILHKGKMLHESYGRGADAGTRFTTWSLVKSITSTLIGVAVAEGKIDSVDDLLSKYLPEVDGTAYEAVTIKQALQMSSGVRYDPKLWEGEMNDTLKLFTESVVTGKHPAFDLALNAAPLA